MPHTSKKEALSVGANTDQEEHFAFHVVLPLPGPLVQTSCRLDIVVLSS